MRKDETRAARRIPWIVCAIGVACATFAVYGKISDNSPRLLIWLFSPGFIGAAIVGGVHGGASDSVLEIAWCVSNALFWTAVAKVVTSLVMRAQRRKEGG